MSFADDLRRHLENMHRRKRQLLENSVQHVEDSIRTGSPVTGAPGQPVASGKLRDSWVTEWQDPAHASTTTDVEYAPDIEDNPHGKTLRSETGGHHSVKQTRAGWPRIVEHELGKLD